MLFEESGARGVGSCALSWIPPHIVYLPSRVLPVTNGKNDLSWLQQKQNTSYSCFEILVGTNY